MIDAAIQEKIRTLPLNIQKAIERFHWKEEIYNIANKHSLQIDQAEDFQDETLLVMVGMSPATSYGKRLAEKLDVSEEFAEILVAEANTLIFRPLQRIAFSEDQDLSDSDDEFLEDEVIDHETVSSLMQDHGIELIDETEAPRPNNDLQKMADELFSPSQRTVVQEQEKFPLGEEGDELSDLDDKKTEEPKKVSYTEAIEERDLRGVRQHAIDMSVLHKNENALSVSQSKPSFRLEKDLLTQSKISKVESFDLSPSKEAQILENGEYLDHISDTNQS